MNLLNLLKTRPNTRQLLATLTAGLLLVLWSLVAWNHVNSEERELDSSRRQTDTLSMLFARHVTSSFRAVDFALLDLRDVSVNHPADLPREAKAYTNFLGRVILQISITDAQGLLTYSNLGLPKTPLSLSDREHVKVHQAGLQDKLFVSRPIRGRVSGQWSIQLTRPIFDKGRFAGVIVISVDPSYFVNFYDQTGLGNSGLATMVRDSGEVMVRSSKQDQYVGTVSTPMPFSSPGAPLQGSYRLHSGTDGVERLMSYVRLPDYGVSVVIGPSVAEVLLHVYQQQRQILQVASAATLLILLLGWKLLAAVRLREVAQQALSESVVRLNTSHELLEKLSQHVPGMIYQYRLFADGRSTVPYASRGAEALFGITLAQLHKSVNAVLSNMHPDDLEANASAFAESARTLQSRHFVYRLNHPKLGLRWIESRARPERLDDGSVLWHGYSSDITDKKNQEAVLQAANQELETFSYSVAHDLNAPLTTIQGFSQLLAKRLTGSDDEKALSFLSRIQGSATKMACLITDLLTLAQVARTPTKYGPVDLSALAASITADLQAREPGRKVSVKIEAGLLAHSDAGLLRVVLENLLGNAWKYSGKQEHAQISFGQQLGPAGSPVFFVRDNGAGFDMLDAKKLFEPFQRLHGTADFAGTGIGLATVHRIILRLGGRIWAESAPDAGATFYFTVPKMPAVTQPLR